MSRISLTIVLLVCLISSLHAQDDPLYRLYQFNKLMLNPAYAGIYNNVSASFMTSAQWVGIEGAPVTNTATGQAALKDGEMGVGLVIINDQVGISSTNEVQLSSSYNIKMEESKLGFGLQGSFVTNSYDLSKLNLEFVDDELLTTGLENTTTPNFGIGAMFMNLDYYVGASIPRILEVSIEDGSANSIRYNRHYYLNAGYYFRHFSETEYKVDGLIKFADQSRPSLDLTGSINVDGLVWFGLSMRDFVHYGTFFYFEIGKNLRIGYAFELPTNGLIGQNYGTHQVGIILDKSLIKSYRKDKRRF
ncbi:PorP/SprF family type IX secretion system membrane protein [Reichenbachiella versicolor]|uniref:PorP/SprF family type IX secretion system membrane protein n=1 Tax=Reichenbachiella versicolor TaxID=1821036 RepID=UPI000D6DD529|nr:PorP/SprF family type IX secretion system membrane protein [Reichenbachiella versicolor]